MLLLNLLDRPTVLVLAPDGSSADEATLEGAGFRLLRSAAEGGLLSGAQVALLDGRVAAGVDALGMWRASLGALPVLWRVERAAIDAVLPRLDEQDDLSPADEPPSLLVHRLRRLLLGTIDPTTRTLTRTALLPRLEAALAAVPSRGPVSVVLVNVDWMKQLNDQHGHLAGDRVLREVADRLRRVGKVIARLGGDIFALLLDADHEAALAAAEAGLAAVRARPIEGDLHVTASAGVATANRPGAGEELLHQADEALFAAKARGRDRVAGFAEIYRAAMTGDGSGGEQSIAHLARVVADRVAETIAVRGRRLLRDAREQADRDAVTGLYSRGYLDKRLPVEVETAGAPLTIALVDVDHFGEVNKKHGWPAGDAVLHEIASRLRHAVRGGDWVARYGGEEICIVMRGLAGTVAQGVLDRLRRSVGDTPIPLPSGGAIGVTVSIGTATQSGPDETVATLLERASTRLLEAKRAGRNQVRV